MDIKRTTYQTTVIKNEMFNLEELPALQLETNGEVPKISDVIKMLELMKADYGDLEVKVNVRGDLTSECDLMYYKPDEHFTNVSLVDHSTYKHYIKPACILVV